MSVSDQDVIDQVLEIGRMAGKEGTIEEQYLLFNVEVEGISCEIQVMPSGETASGKNIIMFAREIVVLPDEKLRELPKEFFIDLLIHDSYKDHSHLCIIGEEERIILARSSQILETMEVEEFKSKLLDVATTSLEVEQMLGI